MFDTLQPATLSREQNTSIDRVVARFREAWHQGHEPSIRDYMEVDGVELSALLIELIAADMPFRLVAGRFIGVEGYLQSFPELAENRSIVVALVRREYQCRRQHETELHLNEYLRRFPDCGPALLGEIEACSGAATVRPETVAETATDQDPDRTAGNTLDSQAATAAYGGKPTAPVSNLPAIPGYELLEELGHGGMGVVYKALQVKLKRLVALKMVLAGAHASASALTRFRMEAEAVARLQHPHVVQIYEIGEHEGRPFFSLEFVDGGSLDKKLAGTPQAPDDAAALLEKLAGAVHAAHAKGIIHRDLKPANVLLTADGHPKVADFGLAKQLDEDCGQTQTGQVMGTASYMSPEQAAGKVSAIGPASDVWALGAILYEMLTGRPPFKGRNVRETLNQVFTQEPAPPRKLIPEVRRDLETICLKCLQKDRKRRYASAQELAEDLRRYRQGEPILARPVSEWVQLWAWCKRNPSLATTSVVAAGALGVVITFSFVFLSNLSKFRSTEDDGEYTRAERAEAQAASLRQRLEELASKPEPPENEVLRRQVRAQADFDEHMRDGRNDLKEKNHDAALANFQAALVLKPEDATAKAALQEALSAKRNAASQPQFEQYLERGQTALGERKYGTAVQAFNAALKLRPDNPAAVSGLQLAQTNLARERAEIAESMEKADKAEQTKQATYAKYMKYANAAMDSGNYPEAHKYYTSALKAKPGDPAATAAIDRMKADAQEANGAYAALDQASQTRFARHMQNGQTALNAKQYPLAAQEFELALQILPTHKLALALRNRAQTAR